MRFLLTTALILTSGTALASSITPLVGHSGNGSVITKSCDDCSPVETEEEATGYTVPVLESGPQKTEIVEINGEKMLVRTEAWLGGSPVVHVSKVHEWMPEGGSALAAHTGTDGIDHNAMVGAVHAGMAGTAAAEKPAAFDPDAMVLRLK